MRLKKWDALPQFMQCDAVRPYYDALARKRGSLVFKRLFDILASFLLLVLLSPLFVLISVWIVCDSRGGVFYRQLRITAYGKPFYIFKFRTMVSNADKIGSVITVNNDARITRAGAFLRKFRLDEIPQLLNIFCGEMSFVGTRPEVEKYVNAYTGEMLATLLLPAGVTSQAAIHYKDESCLLANAADVDAVYISTVLPGKMQYNLRDILQFGFWNDIKTMLQTVLVVCGLSRVETSQSALEPQQPQVVPAEEKEVTEV